MNKTIIEKLAPIEERAQHSSTQNRNPDPNQNFDLERVIWDEEYRGQVMQILNDGYSG